MFTRKMYTIAIGENSSSREAYGYVLGDTGLGYHRSIDEEDYIIYVPTHLMSGKAVGPRFYEEADARAYVEQIALLADWQQFIVQMSPDVIDKVKQGAISATKGDKRRIAQNTEGLLEPEDFKQGN